MPDLPLVTIVTAALAVTLAYTVFGLTGFGAAIVGVPLLAHVVTIRFAVPMMLVFDLCAGLLLGLRNRRDVDRSELLRIAPFVALGMVLGVTALVRAPERWLLGVLGAFVFSYACWSLLNRAAPRPIGPLWAVPAGVAGGVFTALYGSGGPVYTVYLARRLGDASRLRATIAVLIFCTAWARLALFSATGLLFQPSLLRLAAVLLPCAVAGYFIGSHLHRRLAPRQAARAIWILLLGSGASLVWRAASGG
ncbi:MAG TPA: sulfite exporter TauE/SafE family protein [Caldimonas sp.]|nr:sulfite exporter TauE/SafE family protein [Caldimonas sp.]